MRRAATEVRNQGAIASESLSALMMPSGLRSCRGAHKRAAGLSLSVCARCKSRLPQLRPGGIAQMTSPRSPRTAFSILGFIMRNCGSKFTLKPGSARSTNKESISRTLLGTQALMASAISLRPVTMVVAESTMFRLDYPDLPNGQEGMRGRLTPNENFKIGRSCRDSPKAALCLGGSLCFVPILLYFRAFGAGELPTFGQPAGGPAREPHIRFADHTDPKPA